MVDAKVVVVGEGVGTVFWGGTTPLSQNSDAAVPLQTGAVLDGGMGVGVVIGVVDVAFNGFQLEHVLHHLPFPWMEE